MPPFAESPAGANTVAWRSAKGRARSIRALRAGKRGRKVDPPCALLEKRCAHSATPAEFSLSALTLRKLVTNTGKGFLNLRKDAMLREVRELPGALYTQQPVASPMAYPPSQSR